MKRALLFYKFLFWLRCLQSFRMFKEVGLGMLLGLVFIVSLSVLSLMQALNKMQTDYWALLFLASPLTIHFARKDLSLLNQLKHSKIAIYVFEYFLINIPLIVIGSFFQQKTTIAMGVLMGMAVGFLPRWQTEKTIKSFGFQWIPLSLYEWRMGFRQVGVLFILLYVLCVVIAKFEGMILVFSIFATFTLIQIFENCEPLEWIGSNFSILKKIGIHLAVWSVCLLPLSVLHLIFHFHLWYFIFAGWIYGVMGIAFCIVYKYAVWSPFRVKANLSNIASMYIVMLLIIYTSPLCLLGTIYFYQKAKKNMNYFLSR